MLLSVLFLALGVGSAAWLLLEFSRTPPHMTVMRLVWPLVGLFGGPLAIWLWRRQRRPGLKPFWLSAAVATCHCGAGCALGDLIAEGAMPRGLMPGLAGMWGIDTGVAFLLGIAFQYFALRPMSGQPPGELLVRALKADILSLAAWQVGMIGLMAVVQFGIVRLTPAQPQFWFAMQIAMLAGFTLSYPVNRALLKAGIKEPM